MTANCSRRDFLALLSAVSVLFSPARLSAMPGRNFRIRTITAGVKLASASDIGSLQKAMTFLAYARKQYLSLDYEVQTLRIATQPMAHYLADWSASDSMDVIKQLDAFATENKVSFSIGPVNNPAQDSDEFVAWLAELVRDTKNINCSLIVASKDKGIEQQSVNLAAKIMVAISKSTSGGEGNFSFAATAFCPPGTPFFPAAYYMADAFSIGLESASLLTHSFRAASSAKDSIKQLRKDLHAALKPIESKAEKISKHMSRPWLGIDTSPAPMLDISIGEAIETLSGVPFGDASTLSTCAAITDVLKSLDIKSCGYSGLMLPILEDTVLAKRAMQGRYSISDLLLFSSVCGTGLDVVPLPGDASAEQLSALVGDVAALATKYSKPLSARLFPVPGKKAGDIVTFNNPYLTDSVVMEID